MATLWFHVILSTVVSSAALWSCRPPVARVCGWRLHKGLADAGSRSKGAPCTTPSDSWHNLAFLLVSNIPCHHQWYIMMDHHSFTCTFTSITQQFYNGFLGDSIDRAAWPFGVYVNLLVINLPWHLWFNESARDVREPGSMWHMGATGPHLTSTK